MVASERSTREPIFTPSLIEDPYPVYHRLRAEAPFCHDPGSRECS